MQIEVNRDYSAKLCLKRSAGLKGPHVEARQAVNTDRGNTEKINEISVFPIRVYKNEDVGPFAYKKTYQNRSDIIQKTMPVATKITAIKLYLMAP